MLMILILIATIVLVKKTIYKTGTFIVLSILIINLPVLIYLFNSSTVALNKGMSAYGVGIVDYNFKHVPQGVYR